VFTNEGYSPETPYPYEQQFPHEQQFPPAMMPQQPAPPAPVSQYVPDPGPVGPPASSPMRVYEAPPPPPEPQEPMYFIALKDGWVYTTSEYWVEKGTLHYITTHGKHNQVSLDLVDRQTSAKLNPGMEFRLPPP
jgi:hypothetical protein